MSDLSVFNFESSTVRVVVGADGETWFVAADICDALELDDTSKACSRLDDDEKLLRALFVAGQSREVLTINESGLYSLVLTSRKPEAKRFKKWVTSEVLPAIRKTGTYTTQLPQKASGVLRDELEAVDVLARILNVAPSAKLNLVRASVTHHGAGHLLPLIPFYAVDAPVSSITGPAGSAEPVMAATDLLRKHGVGMSSVKFNKLLVAAGFLDELTRPSTKLGNSHVLKAYKAVTEKGLAFGKNVVANANQKETQPLWYVSKFRDLLDELGL